MRKSERKLVINIPVDLHKQLKLYSVEKDVPMKFVVINAITSVIQPLFRFRGIWTTCDIS